jgi:hypothetical protein
MELAVRLWLTINTHSAGIHVGAVLTESAPIDWDLSISLEQLLKFQFAGRGATHRNGDPSRFEQRLTAAYLVQTCGVTLQWSDDIASHLEFDLERLSLTVYRHKALLVSRLESTPVNPIPKDILEEVLSTLDLLFPFGDKATRSLLFKENQQSLYTLGSYKIDVELDLARYKCYGSKLGRLMTSFDKAPRTWRQLAFDRRNKLEWSAFWVTVMVALLTMISIPCNIIQATYSVKAYQATIAQRHTQRNQL